MAQTASEQFFQHFVSELAADGHSAEQINQFAWKPTAIEELKITGPDRDTDLSKLQLTVDEVREVLGGDTLPKPWSRDNYSNEKIVVVIVPGFTHETLRNLSFHEEVERTSSRHHILMLRPTAAGIPTAETEYSTGEGLKVVYAKYPRSNAASEHINQPLFDLLHESKTLRRWVEKEGYRLVFLGYSYGCPLSLELLADLNAKRFQDDFILENTAAFIGLCGAIGGSYLASDVLRDDSQLFSIPKLVTNSRRYPLLGKLVGLPNAQFKDDMVGGVTSLTREVRQAKAADYANRLPANVNYVTLGAVMPLADYRRHWKHANLDDFAMHMQAKVSDPISIYNDGQVVLNDMLLPQTPENSSLKNFHLGAVRAHHWAVSYRTFNQGVNHFPRRAMYRAVLGVCKQLGVW